MHEELDPSLMFVNLGDIDRFGHGDLTGTTLQVARRLALADTDRQVSRFVDLLRSSGRWKNSVVIVLADHSMDWYVIGDRADRATDISWSVSWATKTGTGRIESVEEPV